MTAGLREDTLTRVDKNDGEIRGGGAGSHIAGILLVARAIGNDELPAPSREIAVGYVDSDALFALGAKSINKLGEVDNKPLLARHHCSSSDGADLIFGRRCASHRGGDR